MPRPDDGDHGLTAGRPVLVTTPGRPRLTGRRRPGTYAEAVLVLTRRIGESLVIGDEIVLRVLDVKGDVVRLGVDAPRHVKVHRQEVYDAVSAANRDAAARATDADADALREALRRAKG